MAALHEKIRIDIHVISINTLKTKMFYIGPSSLKILLNLCLLSCIGNILQKINIKKNSSHSSTCFFLHLSVSLI